MNGAIKLMTAIADFVAPGGKLFRPFLLPGGRLAGGVLWPTVESRSELDYFRCCGLTEVSLEEFA